MRYKDLRRQYLAKEFKGLSALDVYNIGRELYEEEQLRRPDIRYVSNLTLFGNIAIRRFLRGKPERRLP